MSAWQWTRARARHAPRVQLARFTPEEPGSRSRAPSRPAILHRDTDLLARSCTSSEEFITLHNFEELEMRLLAYLEANT